MTEQLENTMLREPSVELRELSTDELLVVSGARQVCAYEVANRCYAWRDQNWREFITDIMGY